MLADWCWPARYFVLPSPRFKQRFSKRRCAGFRWYGTRPNNIGVPLSTQNRVQRLTESSSGPTTHDHNTCTGRGSGPRRPPSVSSSSPRRFRGSRGQVTKRHRSGTLPRYQMASKPKLFFLQVFVSFLWRHPRDFAIHSYGCRAFGSFRHPQPSHFACTATLRVTLTLIRLEHACAVPGLFAALGATLLLWLLATIPERHHRTWITTRPSPGSRRRKGGGAYGRGKGVKDSDDGSNLPSQLWPGISVGWPHGEAVEQRLETGPAVLC